MKTHHTRIKRLYRPFCAVLLALALNGCGSKGRSPESISNMSLGALETALPGKWTGKCLPGAGNTFRQSELEFDGAGKTVVIQLHVWSAADCKAPKSMTYRLSGPYRLEKSAALAGEPWVLNGELLDARLTLHDAELVKGANRLPGLYGIQQWQLDTETPFKDRLPPEFFTALSRELYPKGERVLVADGRLTFGEPSTERLEYSTTTAR